MGERGSQRGVGRLALGEAARWRGGAAAWRVYAAAVAVGAAAVAVRAALDPWLGWRQPFVMMFPAVLLVSLAAGWRAGVVTMAVALLGCLAFLEVPVTEPVARVSGAWMQPLVAALVSGIIIIVGDGHRRGRLRAAGLATQARAAAERLRSSEQRYRAVFDQAAIGIGHCDLGGRWTMANDRLCAILGVGRGELLGKSVLDTLSGDDAGVAEGQGRRLLAGELETVEAEVRRARPDGAPAWIRISLSRAPEGPGAMEGYLAAVVQDVTASRRAREDLHGSNLRLGILARTAEDLLHAEDPLEFLDAVFGRLAEFLRLEVYIHYRAAEDETHLALAAYRGIDERAAGLISRLRYGEAVCGTVAQTRKRIVVQDVQGSEDARLALVQSMGITAYACHPLIARERLIGTLSFGTRSGAPFDDDALALIRAVCDQVAVALDNARLREAMQSGEERYRTLVEQVQDYAIFRIDLDNHPASWNEGVKRVLGFEEAEFYEADLVTAIFTPEDVIAGVPYRELAAAAREGSAANDRWMRRKDGERFFANGITAALRDETGRLVGFTKVMRDRTELHRAEEEVRQSEERYRALSRATFDAILIHEDGRIIDVNHACEELFGYSREELLGRDALALLLTPDSAALASERIAAASEEPYEAELVRKDGTTLLAEIRARSMVFQGRRVRMASARDITRRKRIEEELARHRDHLQEILAERTAELEASSEQLRLSERLAALGTLAAGLGHDMGNLLLPVRSRLESIKAQVSDPEVLGDVEAIRKAAEYLQRLTHGLRLLAIDPDVAQSTAAGTDLHDWWPDAEPLLRNTLPGNVSLRHELAPGPLAVAVNRPGLTQAVFNLVQNAGQAMQGAGGGTVTVWARPDRLHDRPAVSVGVTDDGPGMSPETLRRCLEPFFTTKARTHATGMGLPLVHAMVQKGGGTMDVRSRLGRGATFVLTLPAAEVEGGTGATTRSSVAISVGDPRLRSFIESLLSAMDARTRFGEPAGTECLWIADEQGASHGAVRRFLEAAPGRRVVLLGSGNGTAPPEDERVLVLGRHPKPLAIRHTIRDALAACA